MGLLSSAAVVLLASSLGATPPDTQAYEGARHSYYLLKAGFGRSHGRDPWIKVAEQFEQVAKAFPRSDKAPLALYTAAELRNELSRISLTAADRQAAVADYQRVSRDYPRSNLADDALYQAARIAFDREDDPDTARTALSRILQQYATGDMVKRAKVLLATLPEPEKAPEKSPGKPPEKSPDKPAKPAAFASKVAEAKPAPKLAPVEVAAARAPEPATADDSGEDSDDSEPATADDALDGKVAEVVPPAPVAAAPAVSPVGPAVGPMVGMTAGMTKDEGNDDPAPAKPAEPKHQLLDSLRKLGPAPGGVSLAVQMGLRVRRVVIDAGHGGHDSGAVGPGGAKEKDVTLAIARKLAEELRKQGLEVLLSRDRDTFVALEDRAAFANEAKADLFISIHCNAAKDRKLRGTETYFLNVTDDRYALRLAARENQASEKNLSDLQLILADMATKADVEESQQLAENIQRSLTDGTTDLGRRDLGVKHALFYVLLGTRMPSVLVETEFLSNREDEAKLKSEKTDSEIAHDIADGVARYVSAREGFAQAVP